MQKQRASVNNEETPLTAKENKNSTSGKYEQLYTAREQNYNRTKKTNETQPNLRHKNQKNDGDKAPCSFHKTPPAPILEIKHPQPPTHPPTQHTNSSYSTITWEWWHAKLFHFISSWRNRLNSQKELRLKVIKIPRREIRVIHVWVVKASVQVVVEIVLVILFV